MHIYDMTLENDFRSQFYSRILTNTNTSGQNYESTFFRDCRSVFVTQVSYLIIQCIFVTLFDFFINITANICVVIFF